MGGNTVVEAVEVVAERARAAVAAARRAHHELLAAVAELDREVVAAQTGYRSTPRVVQELFRVDRAEAARLVEQAGDLCARTTLDGRPLAPRMPATAAAVEAGSIGEGHIRVLRRTMARLARVEGIDPATEAEAERMLAGWAEQLPPAALAKVAEKLLETLDPDGVAPDEDEGADDELLVGKRADGTLALKGRFRDKLDAELVLEVLDALSTPAGPDDPRDLAQRRAEAFKELCAQAVTPTGIATDSGKDDRPSTSPIPAPRDGGHDDLPASNPAKPGCPQVSGRALMTITIDHRWLAGLMGHGVLDSADADPPRDGATVGLRRRGRADRARVVVRAPRRRPAVLHGHRGPAPRAALPRRRVLLPRLHAPPEALPRAPHRPLGGRRADDLENLTLLCRFHHTVVHHDQWKIAMVRGRPWFTPPAWVDPDRTPRLGGRGLAPTG